MLNAANDTAHAIHTEDCARYNPGPIQQIAERRRGQSFRSSGGAAEGFWENHETRICARPVVLSNLIHKAQDTKRRGQ